MFVLSGPPSLAATHTPGRTNHGSPYGHGEPTQLRLAANSVKISSLSCKTVETTFCALNHLFGVI